MKLERFISGDEFLREMRRQDRRGKHSYLKDPDRLTDWEQVVFYQTSRAIDPKWPFVLVKEVPLDILELAHQPEMPNLVAVYAASRGAFPPIFVSLSDYRVKMFDKKNQSPKIKINNGNHRVAAALLRRDETIDAFMSQETWRNVGEFFEVRRNPWSQSDVKRFNKKCADKKSCRAKWPKIANAVLRDSGDEGKAIRIASWQVKQMGLNKKLY